MKKPKDPDKWVHELTVAIIKQAIDDWRFICRTGKETPSRNFKELEKFFKTVCPKMISQESADRIYAKLQKERKTAKKAVVA